MRPSHSTKPLQPRVLAICALACLTVSSSPAWASAPWPLDGLLGRAGTVFVGEVISHKDGFVSFSVKRVLRGALPTPPRFRYAPGIGRELPPDSSPCVVISQSGTSDLPTDDIQVEQGTVGQAGYRGWILFPIENGEVSGAFLMGDRGSVPVQLADLAKIAARSPYRSGALDALLSHAETVFVGRRVAQDDGSALTIGDADEEGLLRLAVKQVLRGKAPVPARFQYDGSLNAPLPKGAAECVVISQRDDGVGEPKDDKLFGRGMQARRAECRRTANELRFGPPQLETYCGWILFPIQDGKLLHGFRFRDGNRVPVKAADLAKIVAQTPYRTGPD